MHLLVNGLVANGFYFFYLPTNPPVNTMKSKFSFFILAVFISLSTSAQKSLEKAATSPLFQDDDILAIDLKFNIKEVTTDLEVRKERWCELTYYDDQGKPVKVDCEIRVRGNNRSKPSVCPFPPLRLNFKKKGNDDNLFAGQDKIKLVTHCRTTKTFDDYILQEYLTYKHYNVLTDYSVRVRLLKINYIDSASNSTEIERYGIFREEDHVMAYRNNMYMLEKPVLVQDLCNREALDRMTVFQFMIGNTDWAVSKFHNIMLMGFNEDDRMPPVPVPYDFDYAGAIAIGYAVPNEELPINSVRQRLFRGFCRQPGEYEKTFAYFNEKKEEIYAVYENDTRLHPVRKKGTLKYFDKFYETINDPKKAQREILNACPVNHKHVNR